VYASPPIHLGAMLGLEASGPLSGRDRVRVIGIAACQGDGVSVASGGAELGWRESHCRARRKSQP
jgi:hypothetical protein